MKLEVKGNPGDNNTFQDTHMENVGNYNPNAKQSIQVVVGDAQTARDFIECGTDSVDGEVMNLYSFSYTKPEEPVAEILRQNYLDSCDNRLENYRVMCMFGEEGVGMTTFLSQFVRSHADNCVSYFYGGYDLTSIDPEVIETSIVAQLWWYIYGPTRKLDYLKASQYKAKRLFQLALQKINKTKEPLYFVFDGFDKIPQEKIGGIKRLFEDIFWDKAKYLFSGEYDNISQLLPNTVTWNSYQSELLRFSKAEVQQYFKNIVPGLDEDKATQLYEITRGNAHRMEIVYDRYITKGHLDELLSSDLTIDSDLYAEDFKYLFKNDDALTLDFFSLLTFAEFPLNVEITSSILTIDQLVVEKLISKYSDFVKLKHDILVFRSDGFHRYLSEKLKDYRNDIELKIIRVLQTTEYKIKYCSVIPALYKSLNQTDNLIEYLNEDNLHNILLDRQSQASLNEEFQYGYEACKKDFTKYQTSAFRFALNKTFSREIEKNELWDNEVEALLAVGKFDQAMLLAENVYLKEERLKYYLLIAAKKKELKLNDADYKVLKDNIAQLVSEIDFENIPDKATELAKLLLNIDYETAISIVDKVALKHKKDFNSDRIYSLFSLALKPIDPEDNVAKRDLALQKIVNEDLRKFTRAAQGLFADESVSDFLRRIDKLQSNSQKLQLLRWWLPENADKEGIGKAILSAIKLIVTNSDAEIPKAKVLQEVCTSMGKMSKEEMEEALSYINGMGDSIKFPTFDYVDAQLTIISALKDKMTETSLFRLMELDEYIKGLKDNGIRLTCLSKLLGKFDNLGKRKDVEDAIGSTMDLHRIIVNGIHELLSETAYHLKVVEGPLTALVCGYPSMIDEIIENMNTNERKSRAYSFAATQYLLQEDDEKIKLEYFFKLLSKANDSDDDKLRPLFFLTDILAHSRKLKIAFILEPLKKNLKYIENVEMPELRCQMLMRTYIWVARNTKEEELLDRIKLKIHLSWKSIDVDWQKMNVGYYLAKSFAPLSEEYANRIIEKCSEVKKRCFLRTSSCEGAFYSSLDLYAHSLGQLISLSYVNDTMLDKFSNDVDRFVSPCEKIRLWGIIAMQFLNADKKDKFNQIVEKYFPSSFDNFSMGEQKFTLLTIAPALYELNQEQFFTLLSRYDEAFRNKCLFGMCVSIIKKQTFDRKFVLEPKVYDLSQTDYSNLLTILSHSSDDETYFDVIKIISMSLPAVHKKRPLTTDMKKSIINRAKDIVNKNLPTKSGIRHDGYKIVCLAALEYVEKRFSSRDKEKWEQQIKNVGNTADEAFLCFEIAPYFTSRKDIDSFIDEGIKKSESLKFNFDKAARLEMAITECSEHNLTSLIPDVAKKAFTSLAADGSLDDHKHLIDTVYQCKPELAEELVDSLDQDPARIIYKRRLANQINTERKLENAKKDIHSISRLSPRIQKRFFSDQLEHLNDGTGQLRDISEAFYMTVPYIYHGNISDTEEAVLYLLRSIGKKGKHTKKQKELLLNLHEAIRNNLILVLSLAAGTKDRIDSIEGMMNKNLSESEGFIPIGGYEKAEEYLLGWYRNLGYRKLTIIDPYLNPTDLVIIKKLTDENTRLDIRILTHLGKNDIEDYKFEWRNVSSGVQTPVHIDFVSYEDKPEDCPLHDRYWICSDDNGSRYGITLPSYNTLGKKETSINPIDDKLISDILLSQMQYSFEQKLPENGRTFKYGHVTLD